MVVYSAYLYSAQRQASFFSSLSVMPDMYGSFHTARACFVSWPAVLSLAHAVPQNWTGRLRRPFAQLPAAWWALAFPATPEGFWSINRESLHSSNPGAL